MLHGYSPDITKSHEIYFLTELSFFLLKVNAFILSKATLLIYMYFALINVFREKQPHRKKNPQALEYSKWIDEDMEKALAAVRSGEMTIYKAAKTFHVPATTLRRLYE